MNLRFVNPDLNHLKGQRLFQGRLFLAGARRLVTTQPRLLNSLLILGKLENQVSLGPPIKQFVPIWFFVRQLELLYNAVKPEKSRFILYPNTSTPVNIPAKPIS
jgi:hypothetical protein